MFLTASLLLFANAVWDWYFPLCMPRVRAR
jgi:hypothetical protein